ncbi:hypothetical protein DVH05_026197 [Phytophthora capsici]|nr:hypothetical protein DVH05_026197 [Phytophthora capsici]
MKATPRKRICPSSPERKHERLIRHYERQRREVDALTKEFNELSRVLRLEERKNAIRERKKVPSVWETVARQRLQLRLDAEARTIWLQKAVQGQATLIDDLRGAVRYRMKISGMISAQLPISCPPVFPKPSDDVLYVTDMLDLGDMYHQVDTVFRNCGLNPASTETSRFQQSIIKTGDAVGVQFVRRQRMLFSYEQTCRSIWMLSHLMHRQEEREDYPDIDNPENSIVTTFRVTKQLSDGKHWSLRERFASRKFKEANRTVLVWKALFSGEGSCAGMQTEEAGWSIIRPSPTGTEALVEVCMQQTPLHVSTTDTATRFQELLHTILLENSREITNGAKQLLLEHMLTGLDA